MLKYEVQTLSHEKVTTFQSLVQSSFEKSKKSKILRNPVKIRTAEIGRKVEKITINVSRVLEGVERKEGYQAM